MFSKLGNSERKEQELLEKFEKSMMKGLNEYFIENTDEKSVTLKNSLLKKNQ